MFELLRFIDAYPHAVPIAQAIFVGLAGLIMLAFLFAHIEAQIGGEP